MEAMRFSQVDVFSSDAFRGNPVAVVNDADGIDDETMASFANWTNLSETTFLLPPTKPGADYRLRIFTVSGELPFAGHPTLGSCRAWLEAGGVPAAGDVIVQECGAGLVPIRRDGDRLAFAAPGFLRSGPLDDATLAQAVGALGLSDHDVLHSAWIDNGPGWLGLVLRDAATVLALRPDFAAMGDLDIGVIGVHPEGGEADYEVRAFVPGRGINEDPVTGSLNAGFGVWLIGAGLAPAAYTVAQGTALGRTGRVDVRAEGDDVWVGGATSPRITGTVDF
jgi:PhzF family phenazine biosynthesis protein